MKPKKRIILYVIILIAAMFAMVWLHKNMQQSVRDYNEIKAEGILRLVTEYNSTGYFVAGDTIEGFQYELSRAIADISGLEVQLFLEMSLAESFSGLKKQTYDVVARNIPITTELKEEFLFTEPVVLDKQVLVQRKANANDSIPPVRNQLDLAGKKLHIPEHSPALLRIQNLQHEIGDTIYVVEDDHYSAEQLIIMVAKKDIDYAVCDQQTALLAQKRLPEIDVATDISFTQLQSWAVRKEATELLDSLNYWIRCIRDSGRYDEIYKRYYTSPKRQKR